MKLPKLAIDNHQFTLVMILLLTSLGVVSFFTMPRSEDPKVQFPGGNIIVVYPSANPTDLEQQVVDPLEEAVNELEDLKTIETTIEDGLAVVSVEFLASTDADEKYDELVEAVNTVRGDLPPEIASLEVQKVSPSDVNILQVALVSETASYRQLEQEAERLEQRLERVGGVKRVDTWAYPEQEVRIELDLEKMREIGLTLDQVVRAVQSSSANIPGGNLDAGTRRFNIRTSGDYASLDDIRRTVVFARADRVVYLHDVASVGYDYEDATYYARFNDQRSVFITVLQRDGTNIYDVRDELQEHLTAFAGQLPTTIHMETVFDQTESVSYRVGGFFNNLMQGLLLVGLVVLLALGVRAAAIVLLAIPVSLFIATGWLDVTQFQLQQISIVGLVIALGLLVDNAIVVTENVNRFLGRGDSGRQAAIRGTSQIGWAIVSSTVTTILAFLPMVLLQTGTGTFVRSMPVTVIYALSASLLISLTLTPYLSSRFLRKKYGGVGIWAYGRKLLFGERKQNPRAAEPEPTELKKNTGTSSQRPPKPPHAHPPTPVFQRWMNRFAAGPYHRLLGTVLARPVLVLATSVAIFAGSLALFPLVGVSLFPKAEKPQFLINIDTPKGTSLDKTDAVARYVEALLAERPEVRHYATNVGRGNPRIYYNSWPKNESSSHAQLFVETRNRDQHEIAALIRDLRAAFALIPGAEIEIKEFAQGPPVEAPIAIKVIGDDIAVLRTLAREVETLMAQTPGTLNLDNPIARPQTDLHVHINRDKAGLFGIPLVEVDRTVRASMAGLPVANYRDPDGEDYRIVVRLPIEDRPSPADFDRISVASMTGARIPLRQVAAVEFQAGPTQIEHYDLERAATVTSDVRVGYNTATVTAQLIEKLDAVAWPPGYRYYVAGEQETRQESFGGLGQALLIALLGIFGVLVLQFRSFRQPLIVFAAIPFAITGAIMALLLTGYTFSFMAFIGLTSLVGIVVNNSIILVDYANQLRQGGHSVLDAIREAGETRFTPILLTTLTTIGGLLPLTLQGSTLWSPMGWAIIGGLLVSMVLTLVVVPVLYKVFTPAAQTAG